MTREPFKERVQHVVGRNLLITHYGWGLNPQMSERHHRWALVCLLSGNRRSVWGDLVLCRALALLSGNASLGPELNCSGLRKEAWLCPAVLLLCPLASPCLRAQSHLRANGDPENITGIILWLWLEAESLKDGSEARDQSRY